MAADIQQILGDAEKLGQLMAQHPAVEKFKQAQRSVADDPEAGRLLADFDRQLEALGRQEQQGLPVTDAQRQQLEALQSRIISHIKIKALNMAQVEFIDLLRKANQAMQGPVLAAAGAGGAARPGQPAAPGLTRP